MRTFSTSVGASITAFAVMAVATVWGSCATPMEKSTTHVVEIRTQLEEFSGALAQAGMSVPVPPRVCDEPLRSDAVIFDDDVECVSVPPSADTTDAVRIYARAIVAHRIPEAPEARADLLVDAWRRGDPAFASMATTIESEFDARRKLKDVAKAGRSKMSSKPSSKVRPRKERARERSSLVDAGVVVMDTGVDLADVGAADAGGAIAAVPTVRDRVIGTWVVVDSGSIVTVYSLCSDAMWTTRHETRDASLSEMFENEEPKSGSWRVVEREGGQPPILELIDSTGEPWRGPITKLTDESAEVAFEGIDPIKLNRRSKSASCE